MPRYLVDGLSIEVEAALPGLRERRSGPTDWRIRFDRAAVPTDDAGVAWTGAIESEEAGTWARYGRRGSCVLLRLAGTCELVADRAEGTATIRHPAGASRDARVLRRCLPYLAALRGSLVLHAACAAFPAGAVLLCAEAGTGKSTLATALDARGVPVLADDHVAIRIGEGSPPVAHPSVPWVEVSTPSLLAFRPGEAAGDGGATPYRTPRPDGPVPVREVAFVSRAAALSRVPLPAARALPRLVKDVLFVGDPDDAAEHAGRLDAAARLLGAVAVTSVTVPDGLDALRAALGDVERLWT
jgi:hypothetical protein